MKTFPGSVAALVLGLACHPAISRAEDYRGADAVLRQAAALASQNAAGTLPAAADLVSRWREDLRAYRARTPTLPAAEAAKQWLTLFDRALHLPGPFSDDVGSGDATSHLTDLFRVLPPPAVWDALDAQAATRPEAAKGSSDFSTPLLRVVTGTLRGNPDAVRRALAAFGRQVEAEDNPERGQDREALPGLQRIFHDATIDTAGKLRDLEDGLARLESQAATSAVATAQQNLRTTPLVLPELVARVGEVRAEALLRRDAARNWKACCWTTWREARRPRRTGAAK